MNRHQTLCQVNSIVKTVDTHRGGDGGGGRGERDRNARVIRPSEIGVCRRPENRETQGKPDSLRRVKGYQNEPEKFRKTWIDKIN